MIIIKWVYLILWLVFSISTYCLLSLEWSFGLSILAWAMTFFGNIVHHGELTMELAELKEGYLGIIKEQNDLIDFLRNGINTCNADETAKVA